MLHGDVAMGSGYASQGPWGMSNGSGKTSRAPFQVMGRQAKR